MAALEELKAKLNAFVGSDNYVSPNQSAEDLKGIKRTHYETLLKWDSVRQNDPDALLPVISRHPNPEQRSPLRPEKSLDEGSYIQDLNTLQIYQVIDQGYGYGYALRPVTQEYIDSIHGNAPLGTKLLRFDPPESVGIGSGSDVEAHRFEISEDGLALLTHWEDVGQKIYDPEQNQSYVAAFLAEQDNGIKSFVLMHKANDGYVAVSRDEFDEIIEVQPDLVGGHSALLTDKPLSSEEFGQLSQIGIEVQVDALSIVTPDEPAVSDVQEEAAPINAYGPLLRQEEALAEIRPLSNTVVRKPNGDVVVLPEGQKPEDGDVVYKIDEPEQESVTENKRPVEDIMKESIALEMPSADDMRNNPMLGETKLFQAAQNVLSNLTFDGVIEVEVLQRFDEVTELFQALEGDTNKYSEILQEMRSAIYDQDGKWGVLDGQEGGRTEPDWSKLSRLESSLTKVFEARVEAVNNPQSPDVKTAPSNDAVPLPVPGQQN